jgi:hypothetical protein
MQVLINWFGLYNESGYAKIDDDHHDVFKAVDGYEEYLSLM